MVLIGENLFSLGFWRKVFIIYVNFEILFIILKYNSNKFFFGLICLLKCYLYKEKFIIINY